MMLPHERATMTCSLTVIKSPLARSVPDYVFVAEVRQTRHLDPTDELSLQSDQRGASMGDSAGGAWHWLQSAMRVCRARSIRGDNRGQSSASCVRLPNQWAGMARQLGCTLA